MEIAIKLVLYLLKRIVANGAIVALIKPFVDLVEVVTISLLIHGFSDSFLTVKLVILMAFCISGKSFVSERIFILPELCVTLI